MGPGVELRNATPSERDALVELQRRASLDAPEYREQLLAHPEAIDVPASSIEQGYVRVAVADDRILGFATVVPGPGRLGELDGLFVEPGFMRQGIGRRLVEDAVAIARGRGLERIDVTANPTALAFYETVGFVVDGEAETRFGPAPHLHVVLTTVESTGSDPLRTVFRWMLIAAGLALVVLIVSGVYLMWFYRPSVPLQWRAFIGSPPDALPERVRDVHHLASRVFVTLGLISVVLAAALAFQQRRARTAVLGCGLLLLLLALAGSATGSLLAWDEIALTRVTVGTELRGFWPINRDDVRSVLVGGAEISVDTFFRWFWVHTVVLPVALVGVALLLRAVIGRRPTPAADRATGGA